MGPQVAFGDRNNQPRQPQNCIMGLTKLTAALKWRTAKNRELVRFEGAQTAEVLLRRSSVEELPTLAQAALEAADHIRDYSWEKQPARPPTARLQSTVRRVAILAGLQANKLGCLTHSEHLDIFVAWPARA